MKLTRISVEGCGRFGTPAHVEGLGPGVNILAARNEAGKSTLFRAIRTCLFERHSSTKEEIQALATEGLSLPVTITVGFEKDGHYHEIRKSFLKGKSASLVTDGVETARNAEADEEVWRLIGIEPKSARALDEAAYGILWVQQGRSFEAPEPSEGAKGALNAVIQREMGTLAGGERARLLLNGVKEELGRYLTDSGRPKANGPLDVAQRERARLGNERRGAEERLAALNEKLDALASLRADYRAASDPASLQALADHLKEAQAQLDEAKRAGEELKRLAGDERQAHLLAEAQQRKLEDLNGRARTIDAHRLRLTELRASLAPLDEEEKAAATALREATAEKARIESDLEALDARDAGLQRLEALLAKLARRAGMEKRLAQLEGLHRRWAANEAALGAARVDEAAVKALETIEREEAGIRATMEAGAARLTIAARPGSDVSLNGTEIAGTVTRAVTAPLAIAVGPDVTITVSPPPMALDAAARALEEQRAKLAALLTRYGVASPAELRQRRGERMALEDEARDLRASRAALELAGELTAEIERLQSAIEAIAAEARQLPPDGEAPGSAEEIEEQKRAIAERRGELRASRAAAEARIAAQGQALRTLAERRGSLSGGINAIGAQLDSALALLPDDRRAAMIADCSAELERRLEAHRIQAAALAERRNHAPSAEEAERLAGRVERLSSAIRAQTEDGARLREAIARLEGEVETAGGDGLGESAAALKLQEEMAAAEEARLLERTEVLKLLRATVEACYAERREQLNAPLRRHLRPFLHDVFPEADIGLGEGFAISGLNRPRPGSESFDRLSLGTREQIAVLVRLAMGAMIAEKGPAVPVILDDALVFSDDARIERMFDAINRAGRQQQVIVLTCRARSFASLGGTQLRIVHGGET
jgi:uncharacterized protein YoxC